MSLNQIWILQESGTCLFHKKYIECTNNENLISGFLSAVNSFISSFGAEIRTIETDKLRFIFKVIDELIFVACTDINDSVSLTYKRLCRIYEQFDLLFGKDLFSVGNPIPIDVFQKIAPTVNRIFAMPEDEGKELGANSSISSNFEFSSPEARLMSLIRYRRKVSLNDIVHYLRLSDEEANKVIQKLVNNRKVLRSENPDGSELFRLFPITRASY